jgi:cell division protein FtsB
MPNAALRHPETDEEIVVPSSDHPLEWRSVAPYVERFTGAAPAVERMAARRRARRHRRFVLSGPVLAAALIFVELMGLVGLYALDLKALRQEEALKKQIQQTSRQIALTQNELASYKSSPLLSQWAAELGYRPIQAGDFDDVTSNAPLPAPEKAEEKQP